MQTKEEHAKDGARLADMAERFANADHIAGDRDAVVSAVALQSIAHSLAAIAESLVLVAGENGILWTGNSQAI